MNRELTSVLAPGIFVISELAYLMLRLNSPLSATGVPRYFKGLSGTAGLLIVLIFSATGYVVGYVLRELAFRLLGWLEKVPPIRREPTTDTARRLDQYFEESLLEECLKAHPYLQAKLRPKDSLPADSHYRRAGGANVETRDYESFVYAKLWTRHFSAGLNIDSIELEINMLAAALTPSALLALDILVSVQLTWWNAPLTIIALGLVWWVLLNSLFRLRRTERWEAVRNLIMDYAMRAAAMDYPQTAEVDGAPD